uniref:G-protein coupled receptors family 1 profile domain-containing protein n=1 Tax=Pavo cristatus TaxID=9049 RepID=A0A8C9FN87_PAVCR
CSLPHPTDAPLCPQPGPPHAMEPNHKMCEMDVFDAAVDGATLLISLCGLVGNGAVLWLLGCRIRRNPVTVYVLNLAVADFTFLLFMLTYTLLNLLKDLSCSTLPISVKHLVSLLLPLLFAHNMGMYLLAAISIEKCVSILCPLWYRCRRPQHLSAVVCALGLLWVFSGSLVSFITFGAVAVAICVTFSSMMLISNLSLLIKLQRGFRRRHPEKLYVAVLINVIFFFVFAIPFSMEAFLNLAGGLQFLPEGTSLLLAMLNSSINPVIYFLVGCCRQRCSLRSVTAALRRVFEEKVTSEEGSPESEDQVAETTA